MLTTLELTNFRGFSKLKLETFSRVNLVVGENNVGKTSFLEAVSILGGEYRQGDFSRSYRNTPESGRNNFIKSMVREGGILHLSVVGNFGSEGNRQVIIGADVDNALIDSGVSGFTSQGSTGNTAYKEFGKGSNPKTRSIGVARNDEREFLNRLSKVLEVPEYEERLLDLLRALDERVEAVRILSQHGHPYAVVGIGKRQRVPVWQVGQGIERIIGIVSEIVAEDARIVCIDEIENGLHHTALRKVWSGLAEIAERAKVQLFITTHSRECLEAAHAVFSERASYDLRIVQLYRLQDRTDGRVLPPELIEAAMEGEIELR
jgi:AAA15 family ATPase/GTPase